jgi:hypothetical protein
LTGLPGVDFKWFRICSYHDRNVRRLWFAFLSQSLKTTFRILTKTFSNFAPRFKVRTGIEIAICHIHAMGQILFTSGLFVSAITDIIVSAARYHNLRNVKQGYSQCVMLVPQESASIMC